MKRLILILSASAAFAISGFAQDTSTSTSGTANATEGTSTSETQNYSNRILINKFRENWELTARIGTQAYMGEYCLDRFKFKDWWTIPAIDLGFAKWGTNSVGLAVGFTASRYKTLYTESERDNATFAKADDPEYVKGYYVARGWTANAYMSAIFDFCNIIGGYKKDRTYSLVASLGGGIMIPLGSVTYRNVCASFNAGLSNKFRLSNHLFLDLTIRGTLHDDMFNGVSYYNSGDRKNLSVDATIGATVGISYRFNFTPKKEVKHNTAGKAINTEGWTTVEEIVPFTDSYQEAQQSLNEAEVSLASAQETIREKDNVIKEKNAALVASGKVAPITYRSLVNFKIDRWELSNREKIVIMYAAETINANPDTKFLISGYADKQTAKPKHNQMLSEKRAEAVYNCLVNEYGVNADQLQKAAYGGVDYMYFDDEQCSRSVIISSINK